MSSFYGNGGGGSGGGSASTFDLSDRLAKGVDDNGDVVDGAVIEGAIIDISESFISKNKASGTYTHAEGVGTTASGYSSHSEGQSTTASGDTSHAEGDNAIASGYSSHAEGGYTTASGEASHAEGGGTEASGIRSHAEGQGTIASGNQSHAEGVSTIAKHSSQHVFGEYNIADSSTAGQFAHGNYIQIVGNGTTENSRSNARTLDWNGNETLAGKLTVGTAPVNDMDVATKKYVDDNAGGGSFSLSDRIAKGTDDNDNVVDGAVIEGMVVETEFLGTTVSPNKASGLYSHAEGISTTASESGAHAEGYMTAAIEMASHAEGVGTTASSAVSHAEGGGTIASGEASHAEGENTVANHRSQHVFGEFNFADDSTASATERGNYVEIVGNGTKDDSRSNARILDWSGNEKLAGSLTLGMGTADEVTITAAQLTALLALLNA